LKGHETRALPLVKLMNSRLPKDAEIREAIAGILVIPQKIWCHASLVYSL
jgi:hypothetical protein